MKLLACLLLATAIYEAAASSLTCNCGWVNSGRIINGNEAPRHKYPMVVSIQTSWNTPIPKWHFCGGTIITPMHILTAAHCTQGKVASGLMVKAGAHDKDYTGTTYYISRIIDHERYDKNITIYDISLLLTTSPIAFNAYVGPACLPSSRLNLDGQSITALGWGHTSFKGFESQVLREVVVKGFNIHECIRKWGVYANVNSNICTYEVLKSTCQGDSGGSLIWLDKSTNRYTLVALVSKGDHVCNGPLPGIHTDVSLFLNWINSKVAATAPGYSTCRKV